MRFLSIIDELRNSMPVENSKWLSNGILVGLFQKPPPIAKHIIFSPISESRKQQLVESYSFCFPDELLHLYSSINGANLFWTTIYNEHFKRSFPLCHFSIYGYPETTRQQIEPFNISIEDLSRPNDIPEYWLKFGCYIPPTLPILERYLYIDTKSFEVFALSNDVIKNVIHTWDNLDSCLCDIFWQLDKNTL